MTHLSLEQREILKLACTINHPQEPFEPHYNIIKVSDDDLKPAQRLHRCGMLLLLDEYRDLAVYMGTDKGADAIGMKRLGDAV